MKPKITIFRDKKGLGISKDVDKLVTEVCRAAILSEGLDGRCEMSVTYTDNSGIKALNAQYRNIDKATDVLSFPMMDFENGSPLSDIELDRDPESGRIYLGDMVLSVEKAKAQALEYGHGEQREIAFLCAHSVLHLLGYDHEREEDDRLVMEEKQRIILENLGIRR